MSRNMISANRSIFANLEQHCSRRDDPVTTTGLARYVAFSSKQSESKHHLLDLSVGLSLKFGTHRSLTHLTLGSTQYIGVIGFDSESRLAQLVPGAGNDGTLICLLSEVSPQPIANASDVRNVVEVGSMSEPDYTGHNFEAVSSLFPSTQVLELAQPADDDAVWRLFLLLSAEEAQSGGSWIDAELAEAIATLTDLNVPSLPYAGICRSIFDADPRSLYMSLYRCIEATYAFDASKRLADRLGVAHSWQDMAEALDQVISWHPKEASALNHILTKTVERDLEEICTCLGMAVGDDKPTSAGKAIYSVRNRIVHFRPGTEPVPVDEIDWNRVCTLLVSVVFDVWALAFAS